MTLTKRGRRVVRLVPVLALLLALAGGGWMWFRDSGLVRVRQVNVIGLVANDIKHSQAEYGYGHYYQYSETTSEAEAEV